ncbi:hypothetical protein RKD44_000169 [Streptomyces collinus]
MGDWPDGQRNAGASHRRPRGTTGGKRHTDRHHLDDSGCGIGLRFHGGCLEQQQTARRMASSAVSDVHSSSSSKVRPRSRRLCVQSHLVSRRVSPVGLTASGPGPVRRHRGACFRDRRVPPGMPCEHRMSQEPDTEVIRRPVSPLRRRAAARRRPASPDSAATREDSTPSPPGTPGGAPHRHDGARGRRPGDRRAGIRRSTPERRPRSAPWPSAPRRSGAGRPTRPRGGARTAPGTQTAAA